MILARSLRNTAVQAATLIVPLIERVVLVAILVRQWDVDRFADWATLLAAASVLAASELSAGIYFGNRWRAAYAAQDEPAFNRIAGLSITIYLTSAICLAVLCAAMLVCVDVGELLHIRTFHAAETRSILAWLVAAQIFQISSAALSQVFRGRGEYAVGQGLDLLVSLSIVLVAVCGAAAGAGPVQLAGLYAGAQIGLRWPALLIVLRRRYKTLVFRPLAPTKHELSELMSHVKWLALIQLSMIFIVHGAILLPSLAGVSGAALTGFIGMRTLANFARAFGQWASTGLGVEISGAALGGDTHAAEKAFVVSARFLTLASGVAVGGMLIFTDPAFGVWLAGRAGYDWNIMLWLLAPAVLCAQGQLLAARLLYANKLASPALVAACQCIFSILLMWGLLPWLGALGVAVGLALGECASLALILPAIDLRRSGLTWSLWSANIGQGAFMAVASALGAVLCLIPAKSEALSVLLAVAAWAALIALPLLFVSLPRMSRRSCVRWLSAILNALRRAAHGAGGPLQQRACDPGRPAPPDGRSRSTI